MIRWVIRGARVVLTIGVVTTVVLPAGLGVAQAREYKESGIALSNSVALSAGAISPQRVDSDFLITTESGFNAMVVGLFALPTSRAGSAPEGLRGRAFNAAAGCAAVTVAVGFRLPGGWVKMAKLMRSAWAGKAIANGFSFRKALGRQMLKPTITGAGLDLLGVHVCSEFAMWVNLLINSARSLQYNGQTHVVLHVNESKFTGLTLWSCEVEPRWGPDIDDLNRAGSPTFMDNWNGPDSGITYACPTPDDWDLPIKKFATLWQQAPF